MSILNKVSIFVGGTQKSGTRSVSNYFHNHQNLSVHSKKEGHFFDKDKNFIDDEPLTSSLDEYLDSFKVNNKTKVLCDVSPDYIFRHKAIKRIHNYNPNATWLIFLRNPVQRAYSAWNMEVNRKTETLTFEQALQSEIKGNPNNRLHDRFQYIGRSRYYNQLLNLWQYFPKSQCHIYEAEEVWKNPKHILNKILYSLNIESDNVPIYEHTHKGEYTNKISKQAHEILIDQLYFELTELPKLLNWTHNPWIKTLDYATT